MLWQAGYNVLHYLDDCLFSDAANSDDCQGLLNHFIDLPSEIVAPLQVEKKAWLQS